MLILIPGCSCNIPGPLHAWDEGCSLCRVQPATGTLQEVDTRRVTPPSSHAFCSLTQQAFTKHWLHARPCATRTVCSSAPA